MLTGDDFTRIILKKLKEESDGTGHWSEDEIIEGANLMQNKITRKFPQLVKKTDTSLTVVAGSAGYAIPAVVNQVIAVRMGGRTLNPTEKKTYDDDSQRGEIVENWQTSNTNPITGFYVFDRKIYLQGVPTSVDAGKTIEIDYELLLTNLAHTTASYMFENLPHLAEAQDILFNYTMAWFLPDDGDTGRAVWYEKQADKGMAELATKIGVLQKVDPQSLCKIKRTEDVE